MHDYFLTTLRFLGNAQKERVDGRLLFKYLSRWLRLDDFLLYNDLDKDQQKSLCDLLSHVNISKPELINHFVVGNISLRKFKTLWNLSNGKLDRAISISNPQKNK